MIAMIAMMSLSLGFANDRQTDRRIGWMGGGYHRYLLAINQVSSRASLYL